MQGRKTLKPFGLPPSPTTPEHDLWLAVFRQAILDYRDKDPKAEMRRRKALHWFNSSEMFVGSFCWICDVFNSDPDYVRTQAISYVPEETTAESVGDDIVKILQSARRAGLSRSRLSAMIGVSPPTIAAIEKGRSLDQCFRSVQHKIIKWVSRMNPVESRAC